MLVAYFLFPLTIGELMSEKQSIIGNIHLFRETGTVNDNELIKGYISRCCLLAKSIYYPQITLLKNYHYNELLTLY